MSLAKLKKHHLFFRHEQRLSKQRNLKFTLHAFSNFVELMIMTTPRFMIWRPPTYKSLINLEVCWRVSNLFCHPQKTPLSKTPKFSLFCYWVTDAIFNISRSLLLFFAYSIIFFLTFQCLCSLIALTVWLRPVLRTLYISMGRV